MFMDFKKVASGLVLGGTLVSITQNCLNVTAYRKEFNPKKVEEILARQAQQEQGGTAHRAKKSLTYLLELVLDFFRYIKDLISDDNKEAQEKINEFKKIVEETLAQMVRDSKKDKTTQKIDEIFTKIDKVVLQRLNECGENERKMKKLKEDVTKFADEVIKVLSDEIDSEKKRMRYIQYTLSEKLLQEFIGYNLYTGKKNSPRMYGLCCNSMEKATLRPKKKDNKDNKELTKEEKALKEAEESAKKASQNAIRFLMRSLKEKFDEKESVDDDVFQVLKETIESLGGKLIKSEKECRDFISRFLNKAEKEYNKELKTGEKTETIASFISNEMDKNLVLTEVAESNEDVLEDEDESVVNRRLAAGIAGSQCAVNTIK